MIRARPLWFSDAIPRSRATAWAICGAITACGSPAFAGAKEDTLAFDAPLQCGSPEAFADRVAVRSGSPPTLARPATYSVRIVRGGAGFRGTLAVRTGGAPAVRSVEGARCAEVVDALALMVAMALELRHELSPPGSSASLEVVPRERPDAHEPPRPSEERTGGTSEVLAPRSLVGPGANQADGAGDSPTPSASPLTTFDEDNPVAPRLAMATGLALAVDGDVRPLGAYARLEWLAAPHRAASPSVRVSVARTGATRAVPIGGTLDLTWTLAEADACVNWPIDASALVGVCASIAAGNLTFAPTGVPRGSELSHRWVGLGAGLRYQARLTERLFTDVGLDLASPVTRHTAFVVAANGEHLEVYRPVFLQATVHLGVGVDFP